MALSAYVDSVALATATGDQTVSPGSLSFTPVGAIFSGNLRTTDGGQADAVWFLGLAASSSDERYVAFESEDASATSDVGITMQANGCMTALLDNNGVDYVGDFTSFNASPAGFSFNLSNAPAAASILNYCLLGGDVTGVQTFMINLGSGSGNKSLSSLSGTPSCVIFCTALAMSSADTSAAVTGNAVAMTGWMCADGTQGYGMSRHTDNQPAGDTVSRLRSDKCFGLFTVSSEVAEGEFVSMDANGFTINLDNTPSVNIRVYGLAIYGGTWTAGNFTSTTGTGSTDVTTTGVNPKLSMFQTIGRVATTVSEVDGKRGMGMCDGTRRWTVAYDDIDASDPTVADSYLDRTRALVSITAGTPTLNDAYDITHGTGKFTYDHEVASGTAIDVIYLVGGDPAEAGGDAASAGLATITGVGASSVRSDGDSDGTAVVTALAIALWLTVANSAGVATADSASALVISSESTSDGVASVLGQTSTILAADASSSGVATADAEGVDSAGGGSDAISDGLATVSGVGASFALANTSSDGLAVVTGSASALFVVDGDSDSVATVTGIASATSLTVFASDGTATVLAEGANANAIVGADFDSDGIGAANGIGGNVLPTDGSSNGLSTANSISQVIIAGDGNSAGANVNTAFSGVIAGSVFSSSGSSFAEWQSPPSLVPGNFKPIEQRRVRFPKLPRRGPAEEWIDVATREFDSFFNDMHHYLASNTFVSGVHTEILEESFTLTPETSVIFVMSSTSVTSSGAVAIKSITNVPRIFMIVNTGLFPVTLKDGANTVFSGGDLVLQSGRLAMMVYTGSAWVGNAI